jgi:hypothetical protein
MNEILRTEKRNAHAKGEQEEKSFPNVDGN